MNSKTHIFTFYFNLIGCIPLYLMLILFKIFFKTVLIVQPLARTKRGGQKKQQLTVTNKKNQIMKHAFLIDLIPSSGTHGNYT